MARHARANARTPLKHQQHRDQKTTSTDRITEVATNAGVVGGRKSEARTQEKLWALMSCCGIIPLEGKLVLRPPLQLGVGCVPILGARASQSAASPAKAEKNTFTAQPRSAPRNVPDAVIAGVQATSPVPTEKWIRNKIVETSDTHLCHCRDMTASYLPSHSNASLSR